jgi:Tfp pilus assembly protein PilN
MQYTINLIRTRRERERIAQKKHTVTVGVTAATLGLVVLALFYATLEVFFMHQVLANKRQEVERIKTEYKKYRTTKLTIDKADIQLLDDLQRNRIFWTRKLIAMARHLPENYWVTDFGYKKNEFNVEGYGYISEQQKQLITLDDYLNRLRDDSTFNDVFPTIYLDETRRKDEARGRMRVNFMYSAIRTDTRNDNSSSNDQ